MGLVDLARLEDGRWRLRYRTGVQPFESSDPDSSRINWDDPGVHQNLAFGVHPDPWSGMHCWHQLVTIAAVQPGDQYGDVVRRHREVARRLPRVAVEDPPRPQRIRPASTGVPDASGQARASSLPRTGDGLADPRQRGAAERDQAVGVVPRGDLDVSDGLPTPHPAGPRPDAMRCGSGQP